MDIEIQENPPVEVRDLIFVDDMMSGRQWMVIQLNQTIIEDNGTKLFYRLALLDLRTGRIHGKFRTDADLQKYLDGLMHTVKKSRDYTMQLRRK